jgi:hypothetical protein
VAARKAGGLRPSYYPYGYSMMYASEEEEKGRVTRGRGKEREGEEGIAWAYGEGRPRTPESITRAYHVLPLYALQAATLATASWLFQ